jgi:hypothetical protein
MTTRISVKSASIVLKINKCFEIIRGGGREVRYQNMEVRDSSLYGIAVLISYQLA